MKIDTSSYYPEVPGGEGYSLNNRPGSLFGEKPKAEEEKSDDSENIPQPPEDPQYAPKPDREVPESDVEKAVSGVAHFLSWVLVPLMMPVYGLMLAFGLSILDVAPMGMRVYFTLIVAGINVLLPMLFVVILKKMGLVQDLGLNGRKERLIPYIITIVCLVGTAVFMYFKGAPHWLVFFFAGGAVGGVVNMIVNFWWKISAHAAGIAGIVALLIRIAREGSPQPELFVWLVITIGVAGLLGSARVWLGRHTVWQVMAGFAVGFCSVLFIS